MSRKTYAYLLIVIIGLSCSEIYAQAEEQFVDARDGKEYKTVKIGDQTWMAENLAWLPEIHNSYELSEKKARYYVFACDSKDVKEAKATENYKKYGVLYNYKAAIKACPNGWHLPSDAEWTALELFISDLKDPNDLDYTTRSDKGGKDLKATHSWLDNGNGTDKYGFAGLAAGANWGGDFDYLGWMTKIWTTFDKKSELDFYFYRQLSSEGDDIHRTDAPSDYGFSVRCIKDK